MILSFLIMNKQNGGAPKCYRRVISKGVSCIHPLGGTGDGEGSRETGREWGCQKKRLPGVGSGFLSKSSMPSSSWAFLQIKSESEAWPGFLMFSQASG